MIDVNTKLVALLGKPVKHSLSPLIHNKAFQKLNLNYYYFPIEIGKRNLTKVIEGIRYMNFAGFNVTKPNKMKVTDYLDEIKGIAGKIGAVNTVKKEGKNLIGYNTDGVGFIKSLNKNINLNIEKKKFVLLGAGGAGRVIAFALAKRKAEKIYIFARSQKSSQNLVEKVNENFHRCAVSMALNNNNLKDAMKNCDMIINATGVGMYPEVDKSPIDTRLLHNGLIVYDLIYKPLRTKFLKDAEKIGCYTINGLEMLIYQGAEAFKLWTGQAAPVGEMKRTVLDFINE